MHSHDPEGIAEVVAKTKASRRVAPVIATKEVRTPAGLYVKASVKVPRQADLDAVFGKVSRGLFLWRHHQALAQVPMVVRLMNPESFSAWSELLRQQGLEVQRLGPTVWWMHGSEAESSSGVWLFMLFAGVGVGVWTGEFARDLRVLPTPAGLVAKE